MKRTARTLLLFLLTATISFSNAQQVKRPVPPAEPQTETENKDPKWLKVDSLLNMGLPQSALEEVKKIMKGLTSGKETGDKLYAEYIKANLYELRIRGDYEENFLKNYIEEKEQLLNNTGLLPADAPALKCILHSILADLYWQYYSQNRWTILDRTTIAGNESKPGESLPIDTWDAKMFADKVAAHYQASLNNPRELLAISLKNYDPILEKGENSKNYRPTLYDFLAFRAIEFYINEESSITSPVNQFIMQETRLLEQAVQFTSLDIKTDDTTSFQYRALRLMQNLLAFHLNDKDPSALVDADLIRLKFVYNNLNYSDKDSLYLKALINLEEKYRDYPVAAKVMEAIVHYYFKTDVYGHLQVVERSAGKLPDYVKAREWCLKAINKYPEVPSVQNCRNLLRVIEASEIDFRVQKELIPEKEFPILVNYRNVSKIYFRLIPYPDSADIRYREHDKKEIKQILAIKPLLSWSVSIPVTQDYSFKKTEVIMPEMPAGSYILFASQNEQVTENDSVIAFTQVQVSSISYISRTSPEGDGLIYLLDRETGKPLTGVVAQSFTREYNYQTRDYVRKDLEKYTSSADGSIKIKRPAGDRGLNLSFEFTYKGESLIADHYLQLFDRTRYLNREEELRTFMFTDRAIYRPGQTVYFKGILVDNTNKKPVIVKGHEVTVEFNDILQNKISDARFTTNEYGSFSGSFIIPMSLPTGDMSLQAQPDGMVFFKVEEYKRPRFEVTFKPVDTTFKLNTDIELTGQAMMYSGVAVADANVQYRVVRNTSYPFRDFFFIWPPFREPDAEIANGVVKTAADGTFKITFTAKPDPEEYGDTDPLYTYTVYADVTDISGETRSGQTAISVSNKSLLLETDLPAELNLKDMKPVTVKATNLMGRKVEAKIKVELYSVKKGELLLPRTWALPDTAIYDKKEFRSRLPEYPYMDQIIPADYGSDRMIIKDLKKDKKVFSIDLNSLTDTIVVFKLVNAEPGKYIMVLSSTDADGKAVNLEKVVTLYNPDSKKIPYPEHLWFTMITKEPSMGETIEFLAGSAVKGRILVEIEHEGKILKHEWYNISGQERYSFKLPDSITGWVYLRTNLVWNNTSFRQDRLLSIEDKSKDLKFEYETFRSPILPGGAEQWKIKITGQDGKPVAAELLAAMYDASLDAFVKHNWLFEIFNWNPYQFNWETENAFELRSSITPSPGYNYTGQFIQQYDELNWFGYYGYQGPYNRMRMSKGDEVLMVVEDSVELMEITPSANSVADRVAGDFDPGVSGTLASELPEPLQKEEPVQPRKNLQETAFFYPHLVTNKDGEVLIEFTAPEALTSWNFMGLAHTPDMKSAMFTKKVITQKKLMVSPNLPRYFRDGDMLVIKTKIDNLQQIPVEGSAMLELFDALTMQPVNDRFGLTTPTVTFSAGAGGSTTAEWKVNVPDGISAVTVRITAKAGNHSDGEEVMLPVLTNRMLVTETQPLWINGPGTKKFNFKKLADRESSTLKPQKLTLEFTANPAWYALQALPWLESVDRDNSDQVFNRFFANSLAAHIANSSPRIKAVFESWKNLTPDALLSNLEKNQELKSIIIEETPWLRDAKDESAQKQRIALMFDLNRLGVEKQAALKKLQQSQSANGGWSWFEGMPESRYITQWIVSGMGKLHHLGVIDLAKDQETAGMVQRAVSYLGTRMMDDYERIKKDSIQPGQKKRTGKKLPDYMSNDHLSYEHIQFLYALSYLSNIAEPPANTKEAVDYFSNQARKYWNNKSLYAQGMIALWAGRNGDAKTTKAIMASLRERALTNEELGTYWRDNRGGFFWYQAPVETQALMIELFEEQGNNRKEVDGMKTWLLKQKQTQAWPTTTATAEAVYAMLLRGTDWLQTTPEVIIKVGSDMVDTKGRPTIPGVKPEAGTGYFNTSWTGSDITTDKSDITLIKDNEGPAWGAMYYQYFENLDKITSAETPLKISKQLFIKENTDAGPKLTAVTPERQLKVGDIITVRIEIRSDRVLEYVHMKDMRASAFEPVNVLSGFRWNSGLGYYESTRDASTNFFFYYLPKGTHVFEYQLMVFQAGEYSNGISTIQCMYAPEFSAHTEGIRVNIMTDK